jgi:hypothetical protein
MSPTLKQDLCDLFGVSSELVNEVSDTLETIHESRYKKGDAVTVDKGPHKGVKHMVMFIHPDGKINLKPDVWPPNRIRYRLGAVTATPNEVKPWDQRAADRRSKMAHSGRPQTDKEKSSMASWRKLEKELYRDFRKGKKFSDLHRESLDEDDLPFGLESFQGPVSNAEMNRKKDTVAKAPEKAPEKAQEDDTPSGNFNPTKKSASQKEAEREKKLRAKADDKVQDDLLHRHNTKNDEVTFYPSTEHSSERKLGT